MFVETFLQAKHQDCLEHVLSFLACKELANVGRTSKSLHHTVFEANETEENVSMIWQGAERALTNPGCDKREYFSETTQRIGSNAREHCRLFATASKAVKAFERGDETVEEEDRVMIDGVLANLLNVRGHDAEGVAEKKAIGAKSEHKTPEEGAEEAKLIRVTEDEEDITNACKKEQLRREERMDELRKLSQPDAPNNHEVFVRITRASSREVISQGFCGTGQKCPWWFGLDIAKEAMCASRQGFQIFLDFESLKQSEEMQSFQKHYLEPEGQHGDNSTAGFMTLGFNITALIIDKRNYSVQCLFQHDQTEEITCTGRMNQSFGYTQHMDLYDYRLDPKWGREIVQLGPSMCHDRYYLSYSLSLYVFRLKAGGCVFMPSLDVDVNADSSVWALAMQRFFLSDHNVTSANVATTTTTQE